MTADMPAMAATTPWRMEAAPSEGPTVRVSRMVSEAGREPVRSSLDRVATSSWVKEPVISPWSRMPDWMLATSLTVLPRTMAMEPGVDDEVEWVEVYW